MSTIYVEKPNPLKIKLPDPVLATDGFAGIDRKMPYSLSLKDGDIFVIPENYQIYLVVLPYPEFGRRPNYTIPTKAIPIRLYRNEVWKDWYLYLPIFFNQYETAAKNNFGEWEGTGRYRKTGGDVGVFFDQTKDFEETINRFKGKKIKVTRSEWFPTYPNGKESYILHLNSIDASNNSNLSSCTYEVIKVYKGDIVYRKYENVHFTCNYDGTMISGEIRRENGFVAIKNEILPIKSSLTEELIHEFVVSNRYQRKYKRAFININSSGCFQFADQNDNEKFDHFLKNFCLTSTNPFIGCSWHI